MTKIFKKMNSKKFKTIFKDFTNLESFFDDIRVKNIKPQALKNGLNNQNDKDTLDSEFDFSNIYELFPSQNGLFLSVQSVKPRPSGRGYKDWCFSTKTLHFT